MHFLKRFQSKRKRSDMDHSLPSLDLVRLRETLILFLDRTYPTCAQLDYRLVGTGAALLHGVCLPAADVDILVKERRCVDAFGSALSSFKCQEAPTWLPDMHQYYGNYDVNGIEVGISTVEIASDADTIETYGRSPWEHFKVITCGSHAVPTVALELRLITELHRNRPGHYKPIIQFMLQNGCDHTFIERGSKAAGVQQDVHDEALHQLKSAPGKPVAGSSYKRN
jgi:hypothetical protein